MFGRKFPLYKQLDSKDCGPSCLRMMAAWHGKYFSLDYLRDLTEISKQGVTLSGISAAAEKIGFRTLPATIPLDALSAKIPLPCILHWEQDHFVVLYKVRRGRFYVADPYLGKVIYDSREFSEKWLSEKRDEGTRTGVVLLLEVTPHLYEAEDYEQPEPGFRYLFSYLRPYRQLIVQLFIGLIVGSLLSLVFPFLTQSIVDVGVNTRNIDFIYLVCLAQLMLFLGRTAIEFIRSRILLLIGSRISISLLSDYLVKLMKLPMAHFETKNVGDNMQRIVDHQRIESFLTSTLINTVFSVFNLVIFGVVLWWYSGSIFLVFAASTLAGFFWTRLFLFRRQAIDHKRFRQYAVNQGALVEIINSMPEIKLTGSEREKRWRWEELQAETYQINLTTLYLDQRIQSGILFFNELKNILITVMAGLQVINGQITLGMMLAVSYLTGQLNNPVMQLLEFLKNAQDARLSLARFQEVYQKSDEDSSVVKQTAPDAALNHVVLEKVNFRYAAANSPAVLRDVSLTIPQGKVTAIVGMSGSGKTTLLKLLLKYYRPASGVIRVGAHNLDYVNARAWRKQFGVVMQEGYIFSDTIARNIAVGTGRPDPVKLEEAAGIANIAGFIEGLPLGFQTLVGPDGVGLSQGQKQRILIARAAYRDPSFLLFDEATNALDANNERIIQERLNSFFKGRTVVIVAHRLSTVQHADQIVVLERGSIRETGTHQELIRKQGAYFELIRNQLELGGV